MNKDSWIMHTKLNVFCVGFAKMVLHTAKKLSRLDSRYVLNSKNIS